MDTIAKKEALLKKLNYDDSVNYSLPESGIQASLVSLHSFIEKNTGAKQRESMGIFHITGPMVKGNAAPLKVVGDIMTAIQDSVDSLGGALEGFTSLKGRVPSRITARTEISLVASPLPGSITLQVAPTLSREEDLRPHGQTLFSIEEMGFSPLADQAFDEFSTLLEELSLDDPNKVIFIEHLTDLGPRSANSIQRICDVVSNAGVDIDFTWVEPGKQSCKTHIDHIFAKHASKIIKNANINCEEQLIVGTIVTITESSKDKLRIKQDGIDEDAIIALGSIELDDLMSISVGDRVEVKANRTTSNRIGGRMTSKLEGVSIRVIPRLDGE